MLKIQSDRIIIDGHEPTKEQCETMTLLANALAESDKFKTVEYRDGYAEFEKVGKADELKFVLDGPGSFSMYDTSTADEVLYVSSDSTHIAITFSGNELTLTAEADFMFSIKRSNSSYVESYSPSDGSGALNIPVIVKMKKQIENIDGYNIKFGEASTTPKVSVDLTTLPGWSSLSSGSHSITIVAKADGYRDSEPSAAVNVEKAAEIEMPVKGDLISIDGKQYRVLKTDGNIAEVLAMYNSATSQKIDASGNSNVYANSSLDVYLSQTFYDSLSTTMQNAIVAKTFQQDSWTWNGGTSAIANYAGTYQTTNNYTLSLMSTTFGTSISRKCYALSCQDVIDYLEVTTSMGSADTTLTSENVWRMFWNQTTSPESTYLWLRSANSGNSNIAFSVRGDFGRLYGSYVGNANAVRPAFQIDLSKVEWTKSTTLISFTIADTSYQAGEGMTWAEWVESSYNTGWSVSDNGTIINGFNYVMTTSGAVSSTDTIISNHSYDVDTIPTGPINPGDITIS